MFSLESALKPRTGQVAESSLPASSRPLHRLAMAAWMRHPNTEAASPSVYPSSQPNSSEQCKEPPTLPTERKEREEGEARDVTSGRHPKRPPRDYRSGSPKADGAEQTNAPPPADCCGARSLSLPPPGAVHLCLGVVCSSFDALLWRWIARRPLALHRPPY